MKLEMFNYLPLKTKIVLFLVIPISIGIVIDVVDVSNWRNLEASEESLPPPTRMVRPTILPTATPIIIPPTSTPKPTPKPVVKAQPKPAAMPAAITFGRTVKGRPISGYVFGSGSESILLFGAIHGNEKSSAYLMTTLVQTIAQNTKLVGPTKKIIIIPIANPDGYYGNLVKVNANNVNLNRNFATAGWQQHLDNFFAGSAPFSEIESSTIRDIVTQYNIKKMLAFHATGGLVTPVLNAPSIELGRWYVGKTGYQYVDDTSWDYPGTATKWFVDQTGGAAVTVELPTMTSSDWSRNKTALLELIK